MGNLRGSPSSDSPARGYQGFPQGPGVGPTPQARCWIWRPGGPDRGVPGLEPSPGQPWGREEQAISQPSAPLTLAAAPVSGQMVAGAALTLEGAWRVGADPVVTHTARLTLVHICGAQGRQAARVGWSQASATLFPLAPKTWS